MIIIFVTGVLGAWWHLLALNWISRGLDNLVANNAIENSTVFFVLLGTEYC